MGRKQIGNYLVLKHLRGGAFGELWRARSASTGEVVNIRIVNRQARLEVERLQREVQVLRRVVDEHLVVLRDFKKTATRFYEVSEDRVGKSGLSRGYRWVCNFLCAFRFCELEACRGGDLAQLLDLRGRFPEAIASNFLWQIASGLQALHCQGIHHGDLRPGNVWLAQGTSMASSRSSAGATSIPVDGPLSSFAALGLPTLKLANLGHPRVSSAHWAGTVSPYQPPEVLAGQRPGTQADLWSVGTVFHELLTGTLPFSLSSSRAERIAMFKVLRVSKCFWIAHHEFLVGEDCAFLIAGLLDARPEQRLDLPEVLKVSWAQSGVVALLEALKDGPTIVSGDIADASVTDRFIGRQSRRVAGADLSPILEMEKESDDDSYPDQATVDQRCAVRSSATTSDFGDLVVNVSNHSDRLGTICNLFQVSPCVSPPCWTSATLGFWLLVGRVPFDPKRDPEPQGEGVSFPFFNGFLQSMKGWTMESVQPKCIHSLRSKLESDDCEKTVSRADDIKTFCLEELFKSTLFRMRFCRFIPRALYTIRAV